MSSEYVLLLRNAFEEYLELATAETFAPDEHFLDFNFDFLENRRWTMMSEIMIREEFRELTNLLNSWQSSLRRWERWNIVVSSRDEDASWTLREEFVEALAHECLLRPSSLRDTITSVATNALHQVRLITDSHYTDFIEGDPVSPEDRQKHLSRRSKENRLLKLTTQWQESIELMSMLKKLDDQAYRRRTFDYRNLSSHTIGPRLVIGHTRTITRNVEQAMELKEQENGFYFEVPIAGKMRVSYGFGGTPPLNINDVRLANLEQFKLARNCYDHYVTLLKVAVDQIPTALIG
jgi:hypothetical protein